MNLVNDRHSQDVHLANHHALSRFWLAAARPVWGRKPGPEYAKVPRQHSWGERTGSRSTHSTAPVPTMRIRVPTVALGMLLAASASYGKAHAIESPRELVEACQNLERATTGKEKHVRIPNTPPALLCWGYMQAVQDLSVLADEFGKQAARVVPA